VEQLSRELAIAARHGLLRLADKPLRDRQRRFGVVVRPAEDLRIVAGKAHELSEDRVEVLDVAIDEGVDAGSAGTAPLFRPQRRERIVMGEVREAVAQDSGRRLNMTGYSKVIVTVDR
jgi:hypothetical protein